MVFCTNFILDPIPESIPDVKIDEGTRVDINYGSAVSLTCKVTAHPAPKIEWYSSSGVLLPSNVRTFMKHLSDIYEIFWKYYMVPALKLQNPLIFPR